MSRWAKAFTFIPMAIIAITGCNPKPTTPSGATRAEVSLPVPAFELIERSGKKINRDDLKGKVWIASFVFTRCTGPCPQVTATMARLQKELNLSQQNDLRLVTFTVDPDRDQPDELKEYAKHFQALPDKWLFLTGEEKKIHELVNNGFMVMAKRSTSKKAGEEFDHSSRIAIVDKTGTIRKYFDGIRSENSHDPDGEFKANLEELKSFVAGLLEE